MALVDQRRGTRYPLQLACDVSSLMQTFGAIGGVTQNISRSGLLIAISALPGGWKPRVGELMRVLVHLPFSADFRSRGLNCMAKVVRVSEDEDPVKVAMEIRRMRFEGADDETEATAPHPDRAEVRYLQ